MKRWGLSPSERNHEAGMFLLAGQWIQPQHTVYKPRTDLRHEDNSIRGQQATIWRLTSGRGMERFMLTADESVTALERVALELVEVLKHPRRQPLRTNHKLLADVLAKKQPDWQIHSTLD